MDYTPGMTVKVTRPGFLEGLTGTVLTLDEAQAAFPGEDLHLENIYIRLEHEAIGVKGIPPQFLELVFDHYCTEENAPKFAEWITTRGGLLLWKSIDLSARHPGWTGPVLNKDGSPATKPAYHAVEHRIITDPNVVGVETLKEVKRFHVALRWKPQRMAWVVTDGSQRKIDRALARAGEGSCQVFDYGTQEAVILVPSRTISLKEWMETHLGPAHKL